LRPWANVPIYAWHIVGLGRGIVGGSLISMEVLARRLGELALRVLGGDRADAIAITEFDPNVVEFDWRQLQRWRIDESRLPSGSVVRFRQPTTWQRYKAYIITAVAVLGLQTMFIAGLLFHRARRRRVEAALRQKQQRYALATVAGAVGVWDWNLDTNGMYVDPQLKQLLATATMKFATLWMTGGSGCIQTIARSSGRGRRHASTTVSGSRSCDGGDTSGVQ
jgi:PAS domain-containing protein